MKIPRIVQAAAAFALVEVSGYLTGNSAGAFPFAIGFATVVFHNGFTAQEIQTAAEDLIQGQFITFTSTGVAVHVNQGQGPATVSGVAGILVNPTNVAYSTSADGSQIPNAPTGSKVVSLGNGWYQVTVPSGAVEMTKINPLSS